MLIFFCFSKKIPNIKFYVNSESLQLKEFSLDAQCPYGARYRRKIETVSGKMVLASEISGLILRVIFCASIILIFRHYLYSKDRTFKILFPVLLCFQLFILLIGNPGKFDIDLYNSFHVANTHDSSEWFSFIYHLFIKGIVQIIDSHYPIVIIQCTLFPLFMSYIALIYKRASNKYWPIVPVVIVATLPAVSFMNIFVTRDWYFMFFLQVCFFLSLSGMCIDRQVKSPLDHILIGSAFIIALHIRSDFFPQAVLFLLLVLSGVIKFKYKRALCFSVLAVSLIIIFITKQFHPSSPFHTRLLFSLAHPISSILITDFESEDKNRDINLISQAYDYDKLIKYHSENSSDHVNAGAVKGVPPSKRYPFYRFVAMFILNNFKTFITSRTRMMQHAYGLLDGTIGFPNGFGNCHSGECARRANVNHFITTARNKQIAKLGDEALLTFTVKYRHVFLNALWPFLVLLVALFSYKRTQFSAIFSLLILTRQCVLFFLVPAAYFKYIMPMYLGGCLCLLLFIFELSQKNEGRNAKNMC